MDATIGLCAASPGAPLQPVSPERANQQKAAATVTVATEGIPEDAREPERQRKRGDSDVQGKGTHAGTLSKDVQQERKREREAALKRAMLGREEAEGEARRAREEADRAREEAEEGRARERRVGERLEAVMEELHRAKETQAQELHRAKETHTHSQHLYEKEVRRARKEAFKSSSALVKAQEELKATRAALRTLQAGADEQQRATERHQQETFAAQYRLVGVQEELETAQARVKCVEEERDALKTSLKEEELARVAAEGRIALPPSQDENDEFASPKKRTTKKTRPSLLPAFEATETASKDELLAALKEELEWERQAAEEAEQTIEFMKIECQFQRCSCRVAEEAGRRYVYDDSRQERMEQLQAEMEAARLRWCEECSPVKMASLGRSTAGAPVDLVAWANGEQEIGDAEPPVPSRTPARQQQQQRQQQEETSLLSLLSAPHTHALPPPPPPQHLQQQVRQPYHINTTTTLIPLAPSSPTTPSPGSPAPTTFPSTFPSTPSHPHPQSAHPTSTGGPLTTSAIADDVLKTPGTIDREAALAQIRERRGRARSFALARGAKTPLRGLGNGTATTPGGVGGGMGGATTGGKPRVGAGIRGGERRDLSAPAGR
ncbi:MAG: hypothetical protein M1832_003737 [Thelocarpon impressellum]|nr:MAG: hypothetical protein M1832_003737 [Thelocarpon impressellum]